MKSTVAQLIRYHRELIESEQTIFYHLNRSRIKEFYRSNSHKIKDAETRLEAVRKRFFVHDDAGNMVLADPVMQKEGWFGKEKMVKPQQPILQAGKKREDYDTEVKIIYETEIEID